MPKRLNLSIELAGLVDLDFRERRVPGSEKNRSEVGDDEVADFAGGVAHLARGERLSLCPVM